MGPNIPGRPEQRVTIICIYITCEVFDSFLIWLPFRAVGTVKRSALLNGLDFQHNTKQMFCGIFFLNENKKFKQIVVMAAAVWCENRKYFAETFIHLILIFLFFC